MKIVHAVLMALALIVLLPAALADKPEWAGGKHDKAEKKAHKKERHGQEQASLAPGPYFNEQQRASAREYFGGKAKGGKCPPGLAKKNNGCLPPGQARKWKVGAPLPREVVYYSVPQPVFERIGPPPSGHRYVRVAADLLLIAIGTGMVIDAIEDLTR